jgi:hypothetical protein
MVVWDLWTKWHWNRCSLSGSVFLAIHSTDCCTFIIIMPYGTGTIGQMVAMWTHLNSPWETVMCKELPINPITNPDTVHSHLNTST